MFLVDTHGLTPVALFKNLTSTALYQSFLEIQRIVWLLLHLFQPWRRKNLVTRTRFANTSSWATRILYVSLYLYSLLSFPQLRTRHTLAVSPLSDAHDPPVYYIAQSQPRDDTFQHPVIAVLQIAWGHLSVSVFCTWGSIRYDTDDGMHHGHSVWFPCCIVSH